MRKLDNHADWLLLIGSAVMTTVAIYVFLILFFLLLTGD